ncbi:MAG TPA: YihY/virulence factor BrkB family protein [Candidatus Angelobacter sp.]
MTRLKKTIELIIFIFRDIERKHLFVVAAGVAYYFLTALFPALVLLTAVLAYLPLQNTTQGATAFLGHVMPPQGVTLLERVLATVTPHRTGLLSFGIISTLWLSSVGIKGVIAGLDIVYDVRAPRSLWINRLLAFGLALGVGALMLLGVVLTLAGPFLESMLSAAAPLQSLLVRLWPYVQWSLSALSIFAAIELLYLLAPNVPPARRMTVPGAILAAAAWLALSWGLGFYFSRFGGMKLDMVYGILATPIALMIWLNWGATAILVGAEINVSLQSQKELRASAPEKALPRLRDAA